VHYSLSDQLLDMVANAVEAQATRVEITVRTTTTAVMMEVRDNGAGMTAPQRDRAVDPFYTDPTKHPFRPVGLGIPFLRQTAEAAGGRWWLESVPGTGTTVGIEIPADAVDAPPLGDLVGTMTGIMSFDVAREIVIRRVSERGSYILSRNELRDALDGDTTSVVSRRLITEYIQSQENDEWER
jgi:hypothetical protein